MTALATLPEPGILVLRRGAATITVRPAPRREPPFDDELDPSDPDRTAGPPLPFDEWRPRALRRPITRIPSPARRPYPIRLAGVGGS